MDCGYNRTNGAYGCDGAYLESYVKWFTQKNPDLAEESDYPYNAVRDSCQAYTPFSQGNRYKSSWVHAYLSHHYPRSRGHRRLVDIQRR